MTVPTWPRITTVVNSYNYERYLGQAIRSAVDQDYPNKEVVVVDDGSTDGSADIIRSFGDAVVPIFHRNLGQARTCLRAIRHATGDFVHFLDSDDFLMPGALRTIAARCAPDVAKIQFQLLPVGPDGTPLGPPWPAMRAASRGALVDRIARSGTYVTPPNSGNVYRADVFGHIADIDYEASIDGIAYLLAPLLGEVRQIAEPLACYRYHSNNVSGHGTLDAARFDLEARRHRARLAHLSAIASADGLEAPAISNPDHHAFVLTREILATVSGGHRPGASLLFRYLRALLREGEQPTRFLPLAAWGVATAIGPDALRRRLAILRSAPTSRGAFVAALSGATPRARR